MIRKKEKPQKNTDNKKYHEKQIELMQVIKK